MRQFLRFRAPNVLFWKGASLNKTSSIQAAKFISRAGEPIIWVPFVIWLTLENVHINPEQKLFYFTALFFFAFLIPFIYFMYKVFLKKDFDIDITRREKRSGFILRSMISFSVAVGLSYFADRTLFIVSLAVLVSTLILVIITTRWKISFHGGLNTLLLMTVNYLYNWRFWWLFLLLIPIGWARLVLKKHDLGQFIAGTAVCATVFMLVTNVL